MKRSKANGLTTTFESYAKVLLVAMTVSPSLVPAAYGQQEVDPTWYSPWIEARQADAHASQVQPGARLNQNKSGAHRAKNKKQARAGGPTVPYTARSFPRISTLCLTQWLANFEVRVNTKKES